MPSDYFELMLRTLHLTPEERELIIDKRKKQCICDMCPTYTSCALKQKEEGAGGTTVEEEGPTGGKSEWTLNGECAFCTLGKSACIEKEVECLCSTCPLSREMGLRYSYYCTRGVETQQKIRDVIGVG
ncbi:MAG TPA: DUF2769 domain-containing protein [Methanoculleus sp.]|nr:DUF2769 domain-containing protein [Methanoculleus sp.]